MLKKFLFIIIVLAASFTIKAQESDYFDSPFGGGGGFTPGWVIPNIDGLNTKIKAFGTPEIAKHGLYTSGGAGFFYIGFIKNLRIGGLGFGGSTSEKSFSNGYQKETIYSLSSGAFTVEYTLPFVKNVAISVGAMIGGGTQKVELYQNRGVFDWDHIWSDVTDPVNSTKDVSRVLKNDFFLIAPTINVDVPVYRFISFRAGAGYLFEFGGTWKADNDKNIINVPGNLTKDSFFIQTGIFLGFFSY
jgi:hypothetical protein